MNEDFWRSAQETWQTLPPTAQLIIRDAGVIGAAFIVARIVGWLIGRQLRAVHFDAAFRRSWSPPPSSRSELHPLTPTRLVTALVRLTVLGGGLWVIAYLHGWTNFTHSLEWIAGRVWVLVAVIAVALILSRLFTEKLMEALQASPLRKQFEGWQSSDSMRETRGSSGPAPAVGLLADVVAILFALLVAAELTGLTLAGQALSAIWHMVVRVFAAGIALLIGWLGARSVRAQVTPDVGPASSPTGFGSYVAAVVVGGGAVLAILLLAGDFATYVGLILLIVVVILAWPAWRWLPDIYAGILLQVQGIKEVRIDGETYPVKTVGVVQTQLSYPEGVVQTRRNRDVLEAHLASPAEKPPLRAEASFPNGKPEEASQTSGS